MATANRICPQCGTPLASNEMFCSNCGTRYPDPAPIDPTIRASSPDQSSSNPSLPQIEPTQYAGSSYANPYGSTSYGSSGQSYSPPPPPSVAPYGQYEQQSAMQSPLAGFAQAPQPRKGPNVGLIAGVVILLLLLIGGGIFFLTRPKSSSKGTPTAAPTSAGSTATPTQQALFSDNFTDNSKGWSTGSGSGFSSTIANNMLSLSEANHKILDSPLPGSGNNAAIYTDFSVTTTFTISKADQNDSVGLYVRGDDDLKQGYFIDIFGDNSYDIVKVFPDPNKDTFLVSPTNSSIINSVGQQNKLTVIMKGPKLVVLINDKVMNSINDAAYTSGQIALFAENGRTSNGVKASFTSVVVYPAPNQLPD